MRLRLPSWLLFLGREITENRISFWFLRLRLVTCVPLEWYLAVVFPEELEDFHLSDGIFVVVWKFTQIWSENRSLVGFGELHAIN